MSEQRAIYVLEDDNGEDDTEKLTTITPGEIDAVKAPGKRENMYQKLCEYLIENITWINLLEEDQACALIVALVKNHPGAVQRIIDRAELEPENHQAVDK